MVTQFTDLSDISGTEALSLIIENAEKEGESVVLRRDGRNIARIHPISSTPTSNETQPRPPVPEDDRRVFYAAGARAGNVDFEAFERARAESQAIPSRSFPDLASTDDRE